MNHSCENTSLQNVSVENLQFQHVGETNNNVKGQLNNYENKFKIYKLM